MPGTKITEKIARAAGLDAGNRSARAAGRKSWNEEDYSAASREFNRLWPHETDYETATAHLGDTLTRRNGGIVVGQSARKPSLDDLDRKAGCDR